MTESPETTMESGDESRPSHGTLSRADSRDRRLYRAAAWVGIVAGVLFIVATIFVFGLAVGRGGQHGWHRGYQVGQMGPGGGCPMMGSGMGQGRGPGMMGPGMMGPGMMDPDDMGPGRIRPGQSSTAPAAPPQR